MQELVDVSSKPEDISPDEKWQREHGGYLFDFWCCEEVFLIFGNLGVGGKQVIQTHAERCHFCLKNVLPDLKMRHGKSEGKSLRMTERSGEGRMWNRIQDWKKADGKAPVACGGPG